MNDSGPAFQCSCGQAFTPTPSKAGASALCPKCGKPPGAPAPRKPQAAPAELPPADLIPGYEIQKRLGSGGMGDVYLARQASLDRQVAIKLLPAGLGKDKAYVETFLKEARSAARVSHENIVGAVDFGQAGGRAFFVMEHVEGDTLSKVIKQKGALPEARALDYARQVAQGLRHAHKQGLIHRDIKPQNIMITPEGKAKILDFGLARDVSIDSIDSIASIAQGVQSERVHSTPAYASPEQCRGEAALDHRSDLYSLGVTLFEMLTGRRPFTADTARKLMNRQVSEAPPEPRGLRPELSPNAEKIVLRLLRKPPAERFQTYDDLIAALDAVGGTLRRTLGKTAPSPAAKPPLPVPLLAGGAAAAVVVAVVLVFALGGNKKDEPVARPAAPAPPAADPEVERALAKGLEFQRNSEGRHVEYAAVRAQWKELEARYRGTPHHPKFSAPLAEFEGRMAAEADQIADSVLARADAHAKAGRLADALSALREFPDALSGSQANNRIGAKVLEVERALLTRFTEGQQEVQTLLADLKFSDARTRLQLLRVTLTLRDARGAEDVPAQFRDGLEQLRRKIDADQLAAAKKADVPKPPVVPVPPPEEPVAPAKAVAPLAGKKAAPFLVLHQAALRAPADKRAETAAVFEAKAGKSALYAAAALFLARDEAEWKLTPQASQALDAYLAAAVTPEAEELTAEPHQAALAALAGQIAALGDPPLEAFHLFACAHVQEIQARKGKLDPAAAAQAGLAKAPVSELWGPAATVGRIEMAMLLEAPYGLRAARAAELAAGAADFPSKYLGALCSVKDPAFDAATAQARWRKLAAEAPDAGWGRYGESVADRIKAATTCEACLGQGRYPCPYCSALGAAFCGACRGAGSTFDPDTGRITCTACKGKKFFVCAGCNGAKGLKCAGCDGKKTRATLPGGHFRWAIDLGICTACDGTGSRFALAAYPCSKCEGYGRILEDVTREHGRLPAWLRSREGRALFLGLRWLALHQSSSGAWECTSWNRNCPAKGCDPAPAAALNLGTTSLGLLAFLGAGFGPDSEVELGGVPAGKVVRGAIEWILSCQQPDGAIASGKTVKPVYEHLVATYALYVAAVQSAPGELFTEKDRAALRDAALRALRAALALQAKGAGWGYTAGANSDTWVTSWGGLALLAAKEAGIEVPKANLAGILQWYDGVTDRRDFHVGYSPTQMAKVNLTGFETFAHHDTLSAFSGLVRTLIEGKATAAVAAADKMLLADLPNPDPLRRDYSYWNMGTMFLLQREQRKGSAWTQWANATVREILALQQSADTCALGSWPPDDRWSPAGGATYAVSMNALTLAHIAGTRPASPRK